VTALTLAEVVRGVQGALLGGRLDAVAGGVTIDSRTAEHGDVFFAIRGAHQDGHAFVAHARARGATAAVVTRVPPDLTVGPEFGVVLVEDTTQALQRLAAVQRRRFTGPVVAITGSNGKTTTKELTALVLGTRLRVLRPPGSFNNQWGLPLTLLGLDAAHQAVVLELGMNAPGEIAALAQLARPTVGVVTTISAAHLAGVGSLDGVQAAKGELVEAVPADGLVVLNADDHRVAALADRARARVVTFGEGPGADVRVAGLSATPAGLSFTLHAGGQSAMVELPLAGRHNALNAAAAVAVGLALGVALSPGAAVLAQARPVKGRLVWRDAGGVRVLDDTYNANPVSMRAALDTLQDGGAAGAHLWVVLGDMLELGTHTEAAHRDVGSWVAALPVAGFAAVGPAMRAAAATATAAGAREVVTFDTPEQAALHVATRVAPGDRVLVKGSRGMQMERAANALLAHLTAAVRSVPC
jgi:UDP-N-acetylmuramoyl-tripeptide--D-alanyl-D-alanine ligase